MARLNIRKWLEALGRLLDGDRAPRRLYLTSQVSPSNAPASALPPHETASDALVPDSADRPPDRARVARIFDSAHPVRARHELFGRERELEALLNATLDFGQHAIVHGARGSGKTSLVRVYGDHADQRGAVVIYMACEPDASFAELVRPYLHALPPVAFVPGERIGFRDSLAGLPEQFRPRMFVELVGERIGSPTIFIFDEFDRITDVAVKAEMAAAMKLLSDSLINVIFVLVGIAGNVSDVIDCHPSLRRHMRVVSLGRIKDDSVSALIEAGEAATGMEFSDEARHIIARASCGSPFHVRMFCNHAANAAIKRNSILVSDSDVRAGLVSAIEQWATMNPDDAQRFLRLVEEQDLLPEIERAAQNAAVSDRFSVGDGQLKQLLAGGSVVQERDSETFVFRDSVAPQFLVAYAILAQASQLIPDRNAPQRIAHAPNR